MSELFTIRLATPADAAAIAGHRARMFQDMGDVPPSMFEPLRAKSCERLHDLLTRGEYEPEWRRRGIASELLTRIIDWARTKRLDRLVLHASKEGRALYQRFGFVATNEIRFAGE